MTSPPDILRAPEAARMTGRTLEGFYRDVRLGRFGPGCVWHLGRSVRASRSRLLEWLEQGGTAAPRSE